MRRQRRRFSSAFVEDFIQFWEKRRRCRRTPYSHDPLSLDRYIVGSLYPTCLVLVYDKGTNDANNKQEIGRIRLWEE